MCTFFFFYLEVVRFARFFHFILFSRSTEGTGKGESEISEQKKKKTAPAGRTRRGRGETPDAEEAELRRIWSRSDALRGLKQVVSVSIEAARQEIPDENGGVSEVRFNPSAANAATKAIEAANRLLGYGEEQKAEEDGEIVVCFEDGEDCAK